MGVLTESFVPSSIARPNPGELVSSGSVARTSHSPATVARKDPSAPIVWYGSAELPFRPLVCHLHVKPAISLLFRSKAFTWYRSWPPTVAEAFAGLNTVR